MLSISPLLTVFEKRVLVFQFPYRCTPVECSSLIPYFYFHHGFFLDFPLSTLSSPIMCPIVSTGTQMNALYMLEYSALNDRLELLNDMFSAMEKER